MKFYTKILRSELSMVNRISDICPLDKSRFAMDIIGRSLAMRHGLGTKYKNVEHDRLNAKIIMPKEIKRDGIILYLHGGGYVLGGMDYAKGFGTLIASQTGSKVCCLAYGLAPEHRFPSALTEAYDTYLFLLESGFAPDKIFLCGESAGGGLIYALALKLRAESRPLPRGIIAFSPWCDLTLSGSSYNTNRAKDPSMTEKRLRFYAESYADNFNDPYVSPLFGDLTGLPPSLILAGGHEIMLSDSAELHKRLTACGCVSSLHIAPEMWHVYLMYNIKEAEDGYKKINEFMEGLSHD
ncbi:MAG: alpha/beta hydrolase [Oscillospiraceae bacterium]|nr:alpha/beta hydrolase [Oscillospiraceae bacterium]